MHELEDDSELQYDEKEVSSTIVTCVGENTTVYLIQYPESASISLQIPSLEASCSIRQENVLFMLILSIHFH